MKLIDRLAALPLVPHWMLAFLASDVSATNLRGPVIRYVAARPGETIILGPNDRLCVRPRIRVPYRREPGPAPIKRDLPPPDTDGVWVH